MKDNVTTYINQIYLAAMANASNSSSSPQNSSTGLSSNMTNFLIAVGIVLFFASIGGFLFYRSYKEDKEEQGVRDDRRFRYLSSIALYRQSQEETSKYGSIPQQPTSP